MSNLLPEKFQQRIRAEYRARFIMAGSALAFAAAIFTVLTLSPSFGALYITRPAASEKANQLLQSKQDSAEIASAQSLLLQLSPIATASSTVSAAILDALDERPSGVHVDHVVYTAGTAATIAIGGTADSRAHIDKYRNTLQNDPRFPSVKLPVGDLVGAQGGRFTITLSGNF